LILPFVSISNERDDSLPTPSSIHLPVDAANLPFLMSPVVRFVVDRLLPRNETLYEKNDPSKARFRIN
jgi:hypothetical protein